MAREGDKITKILKKELIEGELRMFAINKGEDTQEMYNRLKALVNQIQDYESTKWTNHEVIKFMIIIMLPSLLYFVKILGTR